MEANNKKIYFEVVKIAQNIFESLNIAAGQYKPADVAKYIDAKDADLWKDDSAAAELYTVTDGAFCCSFMGAGVFRMLAKLGTAWGIATADRAVFTRKAKTAPAVVRFTVPTAAKEAIKAAAHRDELRKVMNYICVDTQRRALVASDGMALSVVSLPDMETVAGAKDKYLIHPDIFKSGSGSVVIRQNDTTENGDIIRENLEGRFPNWESVCNDASDENALNIGKDWKKFKKAIKTAAKYSGSRGVVAVRGVAGSDSVEIVSCYEKHEDRSAEKKEIFKLTAPAPASFCLLFCARHIDKIKEANRVYISSSSDAILFAAPEKNIFLMVMPVCPDSYGYKLMEFEIKKTGREKNILNICGISEESAPAVDSIAETAAETEAETAAPAVDVVAASEDIAETETATAGETAAETETESAPASDSVYCPLTGDTLTVNAGDMLTPAEIKAIATAERARIESERAAKIAAAPAEVLQDVTAPAVDVVAEPEDIAEPETAAAPAVDVVAASEDIAETETATAARRVALWPLLIRAAAVASLVVFAIFANLSAKDRAASVDSFAHVDDITTPAAVLLAESAPAVDVVAAPEDVANVDSIAEPEDVTEPETETAAPAVDVVAASEDVASVDSIAASEDVASVDSIAAPEDVANVDSIAEPETETATETAAESAPASVDDVAEPETETAGETAAETETETESAPASVDTVPAVDVVPASVDIVPALDNSDSVPAYVIALTK